MEQHIASYLFRNNSCLLPGIGELKIIYEPADTDFINKQIRAPKQTIVFLPDLNSSTVFNELSAVSEHLKMILDTKKSVELIGVGSFTKKDNGEICFTPEELLATALQPVPFERVIRHESREGVLESINNSENIQPEFTKPFIEPVIKKNKWWIAAVIIGLTGLAILIFELTQNGLSVGNSIHINAQDATPAYKTIK